MLNIVPFKTDLPNATHPWVIRSFCSESISEDDILQEMAEDNTTLTLADISGCIEVFKEIFAKNLAQGKRIKMDFGTFYLSAAGNLDKYNEKLFPIGKPELNHRINLHFLENKDFMKDLLPSLQYKRVYTCSKSVPQITSVIIEGNTNLTTISSGNYMTIKGTRLNFNINDADLGVFFYTTRKRYRIPCYIQHKTTCIIFQIPQEIKPDTYTLELIASPNGKTKKQVHYSNKITIKQ